MAQLLLEIDKPEQAQEFLDLGREQLKHLRVTPARQALAGQLVEVQGELDARIVYKSGGS